MAFSNQQLNQKYLDFVSRYRNNYNYNYYNTTKDALDRVNDFNTIHTDIANNQQALEQAQGINTQQKNFNFLTRINDQITQFVATRHEMKKTKQVRWKKRSRLLKKQKQQENEDNQEQQEQLGESGVGQEHNKEMNLLKESLEQE